MERHRQSYIAAALTVAGAGIGFWLGAMVVSVGFPVSLSARLVHLAVVAGFIMAFGAGLPTVYRGWRRRSPG